MKGTIKIPLLYDVQRAKYVIMELVYMEVSINLNTQTLKDEKNRVHPALLDAVLCVEVWLCKGACILYSILDAITVSS
jgi:hypothetical protein